MKVVIVESPNKCTTIKKYLGDDYKVIATKGHIRDLATSGKEGLGVDCDHSFTPTYTIIKGKRNIVNEIKANAKKADEVIIATDPDREGEAIAWHVSEILKLKKDNKRLEFHEITRDAINKAIKNPRTIDMKLVASQEARRIVDRIIGFKLSDVLQRKNNLRSGGRVQSATLKLIVDHERKIKNFKSEDYWNIKTKLKQGNVEIEAPLYKYKDKVKDGKIFNEADAIDAVNATGKELKVLSVEKTVRTTNPKVPFKTSTLQQEAISRFSLSAAKVSKILQDLYEGVELHGEHVGLITYIRTDSTYLAETYVQHAKQYITERFGAQYIGNMKQPKAAGPVQNAHEAIRPTSNHRTPIAIRRLLKDNKAFTNNHFKIYELIYNRALSYLMTSKQEEVTSINIGNEEVIYRINGSKTIYPGYEMLTGPSENKKIDIDYNEGSKLEVLDVINEKKSTQPPAHLSEAKIIKMMEEEGIGRPSTYSSTISTLQSRQYVIKEKGAIIPTKFGIEAIEFLEKKFADIVDTKFTANLEKDLDGVEDGESSRTKTINEIYVPFMKEYKEALKETLGVCPECGSPLVRIKGRFGSFTGCSNYPKCSYKKKEEKEPLEVTDKICPKCGHKLVKRVNKKGKVFIACSNFPNCRYIEGKEMDKPKKLEIIKKCPDCETGNLVVRSGWNKVKKQKGFFLGCTNYPKCRHIEEYNPEVSKPSDTENK